MRYAGFNRGYRHTERGSRFALAIACTGWVGCGSAPLHVAPATNATQAHAASAASTAVAPRFVSPYTYEHFIRAELAVANGDLRAAADGYRRALAGADEDPLVIARLALTLDALDQRDNARELLDRGDALDPTSEAIWLARGEIAERRQDLPAAIAAYERAESFAPLSPQPPLALARALHDSPERALAVLRRFAARNDRWSPHRLHAELSIALMSGDLEASLAGWHALRTVTAATGRETLAVAKLALERGRPWVARELVPDHSMRTLDRDIWLRVLIAVGDMPAAEMMMATTTPAEVGGVAAMAQRYLEIGADDRAAELAATSVALDPQSAALLTLLRAQGLSALADEVATRASLNP